MGGGCLPLRNDEVHVSDGDGTLMLAVTLGRHSALALQAESSQIKVKPSRGTHRTDSGNAQAKVRAIIAKGLALLGWQEPDLTSRPKNDAAKAQIGERLRRETTLTEWRWTNCL